MKAHRAPRRFHGAPALAIFAACCLAVALTGCAGGPFPELAALNPVIRQQWAADEKYAQTYHQRLEQIKSFRNRAGEYGPAEQEQISSELARIAVEDSNPLFRAAAARSLASYPTRSADGALRQAIQDDESSVRRAACQAWGQRGGPESVQILAQTLGSDTDIDVRIAAARELGNLRDPGAIPALGLALDDADPALQRRAVESLKLVSGRDYGDSVPAWREFAQGRDPGPPPTPSVVDRLRRLF